VYPALSVAEALVASEAPGALQLTYVGSERGMEAGLVRKESKLPYRAVPAAALRGRNPLALARNAGVLAHGVWAARRLIGRERPDAILGTGGYVCVPVFMAARLMGVPTLIYLPDIVPGLAVRMLARIATMVACSVEDSLARLGAGPGAARFIVTGYPVRSELGKLDGARCRAAFGLRDDLPTLLVTGGSRGARSINQAITALLPQLLALAQIIHVCGREGDEQFLSAAAAALPAELRERYRLYPYLHSDLAAPRVADGQDTGSGTDDPQPSLSMAQALCAADLAVCRSGASTLGELPAAGLPAVLVPYPFVHQDENADYLARHGAAVKVRDADMLGEGQPEHGPLFRHLSHLLGDARARDAMAGRMRSLARPDAAQGLADALLALAARRHAV
jgi:UDP-N-acetylglucosamine--N-acetylmuramyl-(pentapeptide) pyrophosphoryl-undecaprenol N-acetylglucosamine transferase